MFQVFFRLERGDALNAQKTDWLHNYGTVLRGHVKLYCLKKPYKSSKIMMPLWRWVKIGNICSHFPPWSPLRRSGEVTGVWGEDGRGLFRTIQFLQQTLMCSLSLKNKCWFSRNGGCRRKTPHHR